MKQHEWQSKSIATGLAAGVTKMITPALTITTITAVSVSATDT